MLPTVRLWRRRCLTVRRAAHNPEREKAPGTNPMPSLDLLGADDAPRYDLPRS